MAGQSQFIANPAIDIRCADDRLIVSSFSTQRGFQAMPLVSGQPGHAPALSVMEGQPLEMDTLSPADLGALWMAGLLILPTEQGAAFASPTFDVAPEPFRAHGFRVIPSCITLAMTSVLTAHFRAQVAKGAARLKPQDVDRHVMHNDPAGRVIQRALLPAIQAMVGKPLRPSYSFASLYRLGASMHMHTDRPQCAYTLSLAIDHQPAPADGVSPWPLTIYPEQDGEPVDCLLPLGGGLLFRGHHLRHGRKPLPPDQICWTLLLHYVDVDFDGDLN